MFELFSISAFISQTNYSVKILQFLKTLALGMVTVKVLYFLSVTYLAVCKNFLVEVEDKKDYVEPSPVENTGEYFTRISPPPWHKIIFLNFANFHKILFSK